MTSTSSFEPTPHRSEDDAGPIEDLAPEKHEPANGDSGPDAQGVGNVSLSGQFLNQLGAEPFFLDDNHGEQAVSPQALTIATQEEADDQANDEQVVVKAALSQAKERGQSGQAKPVNDFSQAPGLEASPVLKSLSTSGTGGGAYFANVCGLSPTGAPLYDPKLADQAVLPSRIVNDKRFWRMARTVISLSKAGAENKWFPNKELSEKVRRQAFAVRFREALVEFGPTFIKLGQFLSVRRDFLTKEMADELSTLQDNVPPFERDLVYETIRKGLSKAPEDLFVEFDYEPIASASIGQVHKAKLPDGRWVVVKVQRPDLALRFYQDLGYMRTFIRWGRRLKPDGEWDSWLALSDEFGRTLFSEIDYLQEGKNADRMRVALKEQNRIRIPRVIWKYTAGTF